MKTKIKIITALLLLIALTVNVVSCGAVGASDLMDGIKAREIPEKSADEIFTSTQFAFAAALFRRAAEESGCENTLISPLSVISALAMTANGAKGETLAQMEKVLGGGLTLAELNEYLHSYVENLPSGEDYKLHLANSIWAKKNHLTIRPDFLQTNADYYGADLFEAPFDTSTVKDINDWVSKNTDDMIKNIVDEIHDDNVMFLINALCFDAAWETPYSESAVRDYDFRTLSGSYQTVKMMYSSEDIYLSDENTEGFIKSYKDGKYSFVALLPDQKEDFSEYVSSLTGEKLQTLLENKQYHTVYAGLPKFEYEYELSMNKILQDMGITDAFDGGKADLSGIGDASIGNLFIGNVKHKTFISVGEKRTKAAAVTSVIVCTLSAEITGERPKTVILDRPFVYMIIENETALPIFIGTVTEIES